MHGATQVRKKYTRETPNEEEKKMKKIFKSTKIKAIIGNHLMVKGIEEKNL